MTTPPASRLPLLPLIHPLILLPASRISFPIPTNIGEALLALIDTSESLPLVAAVPTTSSSQLAEWGTAARVLRLVKPPARNPRQPYLVSLHGLSRIQLAAPLPPLAPTPTDDAPADPARLVVHDVIHPPPETPPPHHDVEKFKAAALRLLDRLSRDSVQQARKDGYAKIAGMLDDVSDARAPWMADVLVGSVGGEFDDRLAVLSTPETSARLALATALFIKLASISEVSKKIASAVDESLSKQQKEFFLRQQLAAIQRELHSLTRSSSSSSPTSPASPTGTATGAVPGDAAASELDDDEAHDADDMAELKRRIEAMAPGSEERKMGVREWRRLKRIPQGSVENGVIRNYLEWLTAVPWPNSAPIPSSTPSSTAVAPPSPGSRPTQKTFLARARAQLDADHYGLDKIKRRLIEYLAVVRLREAVAAREAAEEAAAAESKSGSETGSAKEEGKETALVKYDASKAQQQPQRPLGKPARGKKNVRGPILLFVGPPGTGKTSLGLSIARALDRPFQRIALGGVRDEAEIRGHRRTYVASGPGLIVQALRRAGRADGVILLDEIDKIGQSNFHGDPAAALLEVLDPEQNYSFNDHYMNVPIDLSQVLFICTANTLETISAPLLDRCEVIQLSGYTYDEKLHIARRFLLPKQLTANGLTPGEVAISEDALRRIATSYTREAGVRGLERALGAVVRWKAVEWAEWVEGGHADSSPEHTAAITHAAHDTADTDTDTALLVDDAPGAYQRLVCEAQLESILGIARWDGDEREREARRGVVYGLVVMGAGEGAIMPVESLVVPGGRGRVKLTGSLGEVIRESGELALSWVKRHAWELGLTHERTQDPLGGAEPVDVHLHLPAGAQKKDGPSAGVAMVCAFVSLLTGACVSPNIAMTGEITLRGRVTPVGGIKEKVLGAHRAQITKVILPHANRKDVEQDVAAEIRREMAFVFVRTVREALEAAFGPGVLTWRSPSDEGLILESRL